jgi:hypothetical protein
MEGKYKCLTVIFFVDETVWYRVSPAPTYSHTRTQLILLLICLSFVVHLFFSPHSYCASCSLPRITSSSSPSSPHHIHPPTPYLLPTFIPIFIPAYPPMFASGMVRCNVAQTWATMWHPLTGYWLEKKFGVYQIRPRDHPLGK